MKKPYMSLALLCSLAVVNQSFAAFKGGWVKKRIEELEEKVEALRESCPKTRAINQRIKKIENIANEIKEAAESAEIRSRG